MPRPHTTMRQIRDVLRLVLRDQVSRRTTALSLSVPRTSVNDLVTRALAAELTWEVVNELDDAQLEARLFRPVSRETTRPQPDFDYLKRELAKKGVTLQLLWLEYLEQHPGGYGYSQFCHLYRGWRRRLNVTMRQDHKAGEKLFIDFPGLTIPIYDAATLEVSFEAELFVSVLGASSFLYVEALRSQELLHWVNAHVHAFEFYGGVAEILVPDNLRSGVTAAHRYEPDVNATYLEMAEHYGAVVIPARPYKPRDKAKVEAGVQLVERWIIAALRHRHFTSLGELNEVIAGLVELVNDKPFKKMPGSRRSLFDELDRPALRPLPPEPYEFATWKKTRVSIDYHLELARHYYSVPYRLAGQVVDVRASATTVEVFANNKRVASHKRSYLAARHTTDPAHMPAAHRRHLEWTPERIVAWATKSGPSTGAFIEALMTSRPHPEQGYRSALGVLRLEKRYGAARLDDACARSLALRALSYKSVASILQHGLDQQPLRRETPRARVTHHNLRGPNYYQ
jgi:transposase